MVGSDVVEDVLVADVAEVLPSLADASFDLVMADPPYYKVVGETWDRQWKTPADYAAWCLSWVLEIPRVLRPNGHLWVWGYHDSLAPLQPALERAGLLFRQMVVWNKGMQAVAGRATRSYRQFPNVTELCVNYVKWNRELVRRMLLERQRELGLTAQQINERLGVKTNGGGMWSIYTGHNVCAQIPTRERWALLCEALEMEVPYEEVELPWNPELGLTNVWADLRIDGRTHPTQKPDEAVRRIVAASTRPGARVLDLFAGSLVGRRVCHRLGRSCLSVERDEGYVTAALRRDGDDDGNLPSDGVFGLFGPNEES